MSVFLTDGELQSELEETYASELSAINATSGYRSDAPLLRLPAAVLTGRHQLLSGYGSNRHNHLFCAKRAGLFECVLRTLPLFGAGQAAGRFRWNQSRLAAPAPTSLHFRERPVALSGTAYLLQDQRCQSEQARAKAGHGACLLVVELPYEYCGADKRQRWRL